MPLNPARNFHYDISPPSPALSGRIHLSWSVNAHFRDHGKTWLGENIHNVRGGGRRILYGFILRWGDLLSHQPVPMPGGLAMEDIHKSRQGNLFVLALFLNFRMARASRDLVWFIESLFIAGNFAETWHFGICSLFRSDFRTWVYSTVGYKTHRNASNQLSWQEDKTLTLCWHQLIHNPNRHPSACFFFVVPCVSQIPPHGILISINIWTRSSLRHHGAGYHIR